MRSLANTARRLNHNAYAPHAFVLSMLVFFACANVLGVYIATVADRSFGTGEVLESVYAGVFYSLLAGQVVCHATWSVLCNWRGIWRPILTGFAACLLYSCLLLSLIKLEPFFGSDLYEFFFGMLALPAIMVASQVPLWFLKAAFRWRITVASDQEEEESQYKPLSIAGLLMATTVVAVALGAVRLGVALDVVDISLLSGFSLAFALVTLLAGIPTLFLVLWKRCFGVGWVLSIMLIAAILLGLEALVSIVATFVFHEPPDLETLITFGWFDIGFVIGWTCFVSTPLLIARSIGARLHRDGTLRPTATETEAQAAMPAMETLDNHISSSVRRT